MKAEEISAHIKDALISGVLEDIFKAEQAYRLAKAIGERADPVNTSEHKQLLALWQIMCSDQQTLAAARLFDAPSSYPTRSIRVILSLMTKHAEALPIERRDILLETLQRSASENMEQAEITRAIVQRFQDGMPNDALGRLKESRDKALAHNEAIDAVARSLPTWADANAAIDYAKRFVVTIGEGYFGIQGLPMTVRAAEGWEDRMKRHLEKLGIS